MKLRELLPAARVELLDPKPQRPSYRTLLHLAVGVVQNALNEANNTHRAWAVDDTILSVVAGVEDYQLNASNVGKVLDLVTYESNGEAERQVPFYDLSDVMGDGWVSGAGAQRIAFYRKRDGRLWARVRPAPQESAEFRVSYNVGTWAEGAALDDEPFLSAHHHYFVALVARDALPGAEWYDEDKRNDARRDSLDASLSRRIGEYRPQFKAGIAALSVPRNTMRMEAYPIE